MAMAVKQISERNIVGRVNAIIGRAESLSPSAFAVKFMRMNRLFDGNIKKLGGFENYPLVPILTTTKKYQIMLVAGKYHRYVADPVQKSMFSDLKKLSGEIFPSIKLYSNKTFVNAISETVKQMKLGGASEKEISVAIGRLFILRRYASSGVNVYKVPFGHSDEYMQMVNELPDNMFSKYLKEVVFPISSRNTEKVSVYGYSSPNGGSNDYSKPYYYFDDSLLFHTGKLNFAICIGLSDMPPMIGDPQVSAEYKPDVLAKKLFHSFTADELFFVLSQLGKEKRAILLKAYSNDPKIGAVLGMMEKRAGQVPASEPLNNPEIGLRLHQWFFEPKGFTYSFQDMSESFK
jgi:hypothetical protein